MLPEEGVWQLLMWSVILQFSQLFSQFDSEFRSEHPEKFINPKNYDISEETDDDGFLASTDFINPEWVAYAYQNGVFPMYFGTRLGLIGWFYPPKRAVFDLDAVVCHRSMIKFIRGSLSRYRIWINRNPTEVVRACSLNSGKGRASTWISEDFIRVYPSMPNFVSVEVYNSADELAGGLYGLCAGKLFAGESMFSFETNTSKLAFYFLVQYCRRYGFDYIDSQILNPHTESLGCKEIDNETYQSILQRYRKENPDPSFFETKLLYPVSDAETECFLDSLKRPGSSSKVTV